MLRQRIYPLLALVLCAALLMGLCACSNDRPIDQYAPNKPLVEKIPQSSNPTEKPRPDLPDNPVDFTALQAEYPEAVAWITIPGTRINYAVMRSGDNTPEDYYLDRNEAGEKSKNGSIYMQRYNVADFSDPNTILYGHYMANGSMFADLHKFKKQAFFEENQYLYVYTPGHELIYHIYAVFTYGTEHLLWAYDFGTDEGYQQFIDKTLNPQVRTQQVREGVVPTTQDRVITLSTCLSGDSGDGRLLMVAVLVDDTETK